MRRYKKDTHQRFTFLIAGSLKFKRFLTSFQHYFAIYFHHLAILILNKNQIAKLIHLGVHDLFLLLNIR